MNAWWLSAESWNGVASNLANHLWQTTLCVIAAAVLVRLACARHPRVRHAIWLAASVKFLVPFSVLVAAGQALARETQPVLMIPAALPSFEIISRSFVVWAETPVETPSRFFGLHVVVETLFWFHPMVWWIGARLVHEREQACDQDVLSLGVPPETYAESLLKVCRFSLRSPLPFVAGMTGSDLSQRVEAIMTYRSRSSLGVGRRALVAVVAALIIAGPVAAGVITPPRQAPSVQDPSDAEFARAMRTGGIRVLKPVQPVYTPEARRAGIEGSVELEAIVTPDGTVGAVRVTKSLDTSYGLDAQAVAAARQWIFSPPVDANGQPVRAAVTLILDFRLSPTPRQKVSPAVPAPVRDPQPAPESQEVLEFRRGALSSNTPGLTRAIVVRPVHPQYSSDALRAKIQGSVELEIVVAPSGRVDRARVVKSLDANLGLDAQALAAALQWTFEPAMLDGKPVATLVVLVMDFRLE